MAAVWEDPCRRRSTSSTAPSGTATPTSRRTVSPAGVHQQLVCQPCAHVGEWEPANSSLFPTCTDAGWYSYANKGERMYTAIFPIMPPPHGGRPCGGLKGVQEGSSGDGHM